MTLPYEIKAFPRGGSGDVQHCKIYPGGFSAIATAEELQVWEYVQSLHIERDTLNAAYAELEKRLHSQEADKPARVKAR